MYFYVAQYLRRGLRVRNILGFRKICLLKVQASLCLWNSANVGVSMNGGASIHFNILPALLWGAPSRDSEFRKPPCGPKVQVSAEEFLEPETPPERERLAGSRV